MLKSIFKTLLILIVFSSIACLEQSEKNKSSATQSTGKTETPRSEDFATAQIALNVETKSGRVLAFTNLALHAPLTDNKTYKIQNLIVDDSENGPFNALSILDKAIISKNKTIKIVITYELQAQRINWETQKDTITGIVGETAFSTSIQSAAGAVRGVATLVFDESSLKLLSQTSVNNESRPVNLYKNNSKDVLFDKFVAKNLNIRLSTVVNWMNAGCRTPNPPCTSGIVRENK